MLSETPKCIYHFEIPSQLASLENACRKFLASFHLFIVVKSARCQLNYPEVLGGKCKVESTEIFAFVSCIKTEFKRENFSVWNTEPYFLGNVSEPLGTIRSEVFDESVTYGCNEFGH